MDSVMKETS
jgi:26S proteasome regulatory subunit T3